MDVVCLKTGIPAVSSKIPLSPSQIRAIGRSGSERSNVVPPPEKKTSSPGISMKVRPPGFLLPGGGLAKGERDSGMGLDDAVLAENEDSTRVIVEGKIGETEEAKGQKGNWVLKILLAGSIRKREKNRRKSDGDRLEDDTVRDAKNEAVSRMDDGDYVTCRGSDGEEELEFDGESFSKMLTKVPLAEAQLFAKMSYLGNLAYSIPKIKPESLLRFHGLRFVSSSIEKRESAAKSENFRVLSEAQTIIKDEKQQAKCEQSNSRSRIISPTVAHRIAASAASYLYSRSKNIIPFRSSRSQDDDFADKMSESEVASLMATTDSVTAVVAAEEEVKQAVADDLKSISSSPCEWFVCDDDKTATRFFVIQGSESLASWQANLLFEPVPFEELDVLVHRGIYEAAKGIYEQMLPEVHAHLKSRAKNRAFLRFTGHSLGGSLSLLVNLMLLIRGQVHSSALRPVITFGSPCIMCGGDMLLQRLGLRKSHLQAIVLHRDIVPRAFSCSYPNHVVELLKAVNGNFRNHPCLNEQKLLYAPMGELLILQPDEKFSPHHPLLPRSCGLYILTSTSTDVEESERKVRAAKTAFFNSPHPLEILSDRSAYGSEGIIKQDHDMRSYIKSLNQVIRLELKQRETNHDSRHVEFIFPRIVRTGKESLKRVGEFIASQRIHLLIVYFFPVRLLLMSVWCHLSPLTSKFSFL